MAPDFDMLTGDVLMGNGVELQVTTPAEHYIVQNIQQPIVKKNTIKQVSQQQQMQLNDIKSPEKMKLLDYVQPSSITVSAPSMTSSTPIAIDKPKVKILKKLSIGNGGAQNVTVKRNEPATTMKDTSGTIVINKANGSFSGMCLLCTATRYLCVCVIITF